MNWLKLFSELESLLAVLREAAKILAPLRRLPKERDEDFVRRCAVHRLDGETPGAFLLRAKEAEDKFNAAKCAALDAAGAMQARVQGVCAARISEAVEV